MVQSLGLCALTAEGPGSIPGRGTKIPQARQHSPKKKKVNIKSFVRAFVLVFWLTGAFHTGLVWKGLVSFG